MSGGSYDYLCHKSAGELLEAHHDTIQRMADRLAELGYADDAALETNDLILELRRVNSRLTARLQRLEPVWHAVEWWDSCDWGEDQVKATLAEYRGDSTP